jgi:hypothetical protein
MVREPSHAKNDIHRTDFKTVILPAAASLLSHRNGLVD